MKQRFKLATEELKDMAGQRQALEETIAAKDRAESTLAERTREADCLTQELKAAEQQIVHLKVPCDNAISLLSDVSCLPGRCSGLREQDSSTQ